MDSLEIESSIEALQSSYEEIPYYFHASSTGHPDNIAARARLFGLDPPGLNKAKVLELACGRGGNLAAIASQLPGSTCLGIDLSREHIKDASTLAEKAGLTNLEFRQADILDIDELPGPFDYIVVQGTFTWVPEVVRNKILSLCNHFLSDNGLACIAYATYPGYRVDQSVRDLLRFHTRSSENPENRLEQAINLVNLFAEKLEDTGHWYMPMIKYLQQSMKHGSTNFYHEFLNVETAPLHFHEFIDQAKLHSLKFVCESFEEPHQNQVLIDRLHDEFNKIPDRIRREQYKDFVTNRRARESILCRDGQKLRHLSTASLRSNHFSSPATGFGGDGQKGFRIEGLGSTRIRDSAMVAVVDKLVDAFPSTVPFDSLKRPFVAERGASGSGEGDLAMSLYELVKNGFVSMHMSPIQCAGFVSEKPKSTPLIRYFAENSDYGNVVNLHHQMIWINTLQRRLLQQLDGTKTRRELADMALGWLDDGVFRIPDIDPLEDSKEVTIAYLNVAVDKALKFFQKHAMLVS